MCERWRRGVSALSAYRIRLTGQETAAAAGENRKGKKDSLSGRASKAAAGKLTDKNKKTWREERELFDSRQTNDTIHYRDEVIIPNNNNNNNMNSSGATDVKNPNGPFLFFPVFHDGWISSVRLAGQNNDNVLIY